MKLEKQKDEIFYLKLDNYRKLVKEIELTRGGYTRTRFERLIIKIGQELGYRFRHEKLSIEAELYASQLLQHEIGVLLINLLGELFLKAPVIPPLSYEK